MGWLRRSVLIALIAPLSVTPVLAQGPVYNLGRTPSEKEIQAWDIAILPDGQALPPGSGSAAQGVTVYQQRGCGVCHGPTGIEGPARRLAGPGRTPGGTGTWPFATSVWDYIHRAMPYNHPGWLTDEESYALAALVLYRNGIIGENDVMNATTLPKVHMPERQRYREPPTWKPRTPRRGPAMAQP